MIQVNANGKTGCHDAGIFGGDVMQNSQDKIRVRDLFVRIGHWTMAAAFAVAHFTAEQLNDLHIAVGYWVGGYVVARTIWGFFGSRHARFSDFVRGPGAVFGYVADLFKGGPPTTSGITLPAAP